MAQGKPITLKANQLHLFSLPLMYFEWRCPALLQVLSDREHLMLHLPVKEVRSPK